MASTINASTTSGLVQTADTSGILALQTAGTTAVTLDASQNATFAGSVKTNTLTSAASTALTLQSAGTTAVTVDTSQNVGIGTSSPSQKLHVNGGALVKNDSGFVRVDNAAGTGFPFMNPSGYYVDGGWQARIYASGVGNNQSMLFDTVGTERMRVDTSGNLLVGTTNNPTSSRLNVAGRVMAANNNVNASAGNEYFYINGGDRYIVTHGTSLSGAAVHFYFQNPNGDVGNIQTNGSSTAYNTSSDYRLKENIAPMTGALAKVSALKPVIYNWKVDNSVGEGFIAHELAEVVPQCVSGKKDAINEKGKPIYQSVDTSFLVATLTAAIQELKAINDTQAETINALTARIVALEARA